MLYGYCIRQPPIAAVVIAQHLGVMPPCPKPKQVAAAKARPLELLRPKSKSVVTAQHLRAMPYSKPTQAPPFEEIVAFKARPPELMRLPQAVVTAQALRAMPCPKPTQAPPELPSEAVVTAQHLRAMPCPKPTQAPLTVIIFSDSDCDDTHTQPLQTATAPPTPSTATAVPEIIFSDVTALRPRQPEPKRPRQPEPKRPPAPLPPLLDHLAFLRGAIAAAEPSAAEGLRRQYEHFRRTACF